MSTAETQSWQCDAETYHNHPNISHSMLKQFRRSRRDYYAIHEVKTKLQPPPSDEMKLGTALHYAILEPELLHQGVAFAPECDRRTKEGKALWDEFQQESADKTVLPWSYRNNLDEMLEAIKSNDAAMSILERCTSREQSIRWQDVETGLLLKSRLDAVIRDTDPMVVADVKTCRDVTPGGFARAMAALGYHTQAAFYSEGCQVVFDQKQPPRFVFIAVSNCEPFSCAVYEIHADAIDRGNRLNRRALMALRDCYESEDFREPHEKQITMLGLPRYESFADEWSLE